MELLIVETKLYIELVFILVFGYAEDAPSIPSYHEFVLGLTIKGGQSMHFFL